MACLLPFCVWEEYVAGKLGAAEYEAGKLGGSQVRRGECGKFFSEIKPAERVVAEAEPRSWFNF